MKEYIVVSNKIGYELVAYKNMVALGVNELMGSPLYKITTEIFRSDKNSWNGLGEKLTEEELKALDGYENKAYDLDQIKGDAKFFGVKP